ncbi:MAG TPA: beta-propeller domain-containing protein [Candidatus Thermoplasmatota archaeon]
MSYAKLSAIGLTGLLVASLGIALTLQPTTYGPLPAPGSYSNTTFYGATGYGAYVAVPPPSSCGEWARIGSEAELRERINNSYGIYYDIAPLPPGTERAMGAEAGSADAGSPSPPEYSGTNVQTAGIDEPDIVKTDGWYIYAISGGTVTITLAYPASEARLVSTLTLDNHYPYGLFVAGDRLIVLTSLYEYYAYEGGDVRAGAQMYPYYSTPRSSMLVYDISDVRSPSLAANITVSGYTTGARMIGSDIFLVAQHYIHLDADDALALPSIWVDGDKRTLGATDIGYFPDAYNTSSVTTVTVMNLTRPAEATHTALLTTAGSQLYVSRNSVYLVGYGSSAATLWQAWADVSTVHRLYIYQGTVACALTGEVPGHVLNQFSMDEFGGHLRIATTEWRADRTATTLNHVFVLNGTLDIVGSIEGMAPGESIQAVRFAGERAYVVTFEQIDPFFVLDLADPTAPSILGELKITGFSQYLHPISDSLVIGIGVETSMPDPTGRVTRQGFKVSLFNVSDVSNPREVSKDVVEGLSVYSEAQWDHHAFLWMPARSLLVLPLQVYEGDWSTGYTTYWQGVYVWRVTEEGIERVGSVSQVGTIDAQSSYYGSSYYQVRRTLYIGENLYTVSDTAIQINDLETLSFVRSVTVWTPPAYDNPWWWFGGGPVTTEDSTGPVAGSAESPPPA